MFLVWVISKTAGELESYLPWRFTLEGVSASTDAKLCQLPPYPSRGRYVVLDPPDTGPGDLLDHALIVQYERDEDDSKIETKLLRCASGRWSETIFRFEEEKLYFNVSWCPLFCPPPERSDAEGNSSPPLKIESAPAEKQPSQTIEDPNPGICKLPPYPVGGGYHVVNLLNPKEGDTYSSIGDLQQYVINEKNGVYEIMELACNKGIWYVKFFKGDSEKLKFNNPNTWCPLLCTSSVFNKFSGPPKEPDPIVSFRNSNLPEEKKNQTSCKLPPYPIDGNYTVVNRPEAAPGDVVGAARLSYSCYSNRMLVGSKDAYCIEGVWSNEAPKCIRCGSIDSFALEQISAEEAVRRELPWHVAVYDRHRAHEHVCSGSIVATNLVITAAHCFWSDAGGPLPASRFAIVAGNIYVDWDSPLDKHTQTSEVAEIIVHPSYRDKETSYSNNLAMVLLGNPLNYTDYVKSVCVDFDVKLDERQLSNGNFGKIGSWRSILENGTDISKLKVNWTPYVNAKNCVSNSTASLSPYITSDKICAGDIEGTKLCKVDGGGGLSYHVWTDDGARVNYLRGIASTAPTDDGECNVHPIGVYTHLLSHEDFVKQHLREAIW